MGVCLLFCALFLASCKGKEDPAAPAEGEIAVSYINKDMTALVTETYEFQSAGTVEQLMEVIDLWNETSQDLNRKSPLQMGFTVDGYLLDGKNLTIEVGADYKRLSRSEEVLIRAALVRTLTQIKGVSSLSINVEKEPLTDSAGYLYGAMTPDMFIDSNGGEINNYDEVTLRLYFANDTGDRLVAVNQRIFRNTNTSMERLIVEELVDGPSGSTGKPVLQEKTRVISVMITDGTCYVNLSSDFLSGCNGVTPEVTLYAVVDSLAELSNIYRVQFLVEGSTDHMYQESMDLNLTYTRNLDIVE